MSSYETPIRWRDDTGWEARCGDCAARNEARFWPLTDEFWDKRKSMRRCRSCQKSLEAKRARESYQSDTAVRERRRLAARRYRAQTLASQRIKAKTKWEAIKADPERYEANKARARESQRRWRERRRAA